MGEKMWGKLTEALKARGWDQGELEAALELPAGRISKWKSKPKNLSVIDALRIARAVGLSLDYLADDDAPDPAAPSLSRDEEFVIGLMRRTGITALDITSRLAATPRDSPSPPNYASPATLTAPDPSKLPAAGLPSATGPERKSGGRSGNG